MRRIIIPLIAAVGMALAIPFATASGSGGLSAGQLSKAGWTCFNVVSPVVGPLGVHCSPPGQGFPPTGQPHIQLLYFFHTTDPNSTVPDYTGTETLIRADLYHGQPCPTEPGPNGGYTYLPDIGLPLPYYGCHRQTP
jgi:hypothetical protein